MARCRRRNFVELGGKVLGPMIKRTAHDSEVVSVVTMEDIEALARPCKAAALSPNERIWQMFDLTGMTALVTGASRRDRFRHRARLAGQGARLALSGSNAAKLRSFREELNERDAAASAGSRSRRDHLRPVESRAGRGAGPRGDRYAGQDRHTRQQCRHHPRQSGHAHEGRGVGTGDAGEPRSPRSA